MSCFEDGYIYHHKLSDPGSIVIIFYFYEKNRKVHAKKWLLLRDMKNLETLNIGLREESFMWGMQGGRCVFISWRT